MHRDDSALAGLCSDNIIEVMLLQGLWTDGQLAFTVALDQRLHCWQIPHCTQLRRHRCTNDNRETFALGDNDKWQTVGHAAASVVSDRGLREQEPYSGEATICLLGSTVTQVLEPAALDAVYSSADQTYHVLVAGRGSQLLNMTM